MNACSIRSQNPTKYLVIELSKSNTKGNSTASSFNQFLKEKKLKIDFYTQANENIKDLIIIKYYKNNTMNLIYEGSYLSPDNFDSLYKKIISL